jgi:hypothetical protein
MMYRTFTGGNSFCDFQITQLDRGGGPASLLDRIQNDSRRNSGNGSE